MKKNILYSSITFIVIFLSHAIYSALKSIRISNQWVQIEDISAFSLYFEQQYFFLSYSYALAGAFTIYAVVRTFKNNNCGISGIVGGVTLTGILYVGGCFFIGCCGSPMLVVYLTLFGTSFLGFSKPFMAALTTLSIIIGYLIIEKNIKKKSCG